MARGAMRGALSAAFGLTVLQVAVSAGGSTKIGGLLGVVNGLVLRAFDPSVPAIKDHRDGTAGTEAKSPPAPGTGQAARGAAAAATTAPTSGTRWPSYNVPVPTSARTN